MVKQRLWTPEQDEWILNYYKDFAKQGLGTIEFNKKFGTNYTAKSNVISSRYTNLKRRKTGEGCEWYTEEMAEWIKSNYMLYTANELTRLFNEKFNQSRSVNSINNHLHNKGLTNKHQQFTVEEIVFIEERYGSIKTAQIQEEFERTFGHKVSKTTVNRTGYRVKDSYKKQHLDGASVGKPTRSSSGRCTLRLYKGKKGVKSIPTSIYENSKLVPNCARAYVELKALKKEMKK